MATIFLPKGATFIAFADLAHLIADAMCPSKGPDDDRMEYGATRLQFDDELERAVRTGKLTVRNPLSRKPHTFPLGHALASAVVAIDEVRAFLADCGVSVAESEGAIALRIAEPTLGADSAIDQRQRRGEEWKTMARDRARAIIAEQRARDLHPNQINVAEQIAREFRAAQPQVVGADGKPLTGETIKRHALKGISSAQGKARSTAGHQGK